MIQKEMIMLINIFTSYVMCTSPMMHSVPLKMYLSFDFNNNLITINLNANLNDKDKSPVNYKDLVFGVPNGADESLEKLQFTNIIRDKNGQILPAIDQLVLKDWRVTSKGYTALVVSKNIGNIPVTCRPYYTH